MSSFQLVGLPPEPFAPFFAMTDRELAGWDARRVIAGESDRLPCRISLVDAACGDELLLLPYPHQPADTPYNASGPIYVRRAARQKILDAGEIPDYVSRRLISVRGYDADHFMIDADVCDGPNVAAEIERQFRNPLVSYIHLHNAKRGCYSCLVNRV